MKRLNLVFPTQELKQQAIDFKQEHFKNNQFTINGSALLDKIECYEDWLKLVQDNSCDKTVSKDWVVSKTFFGINNAEGKIIGIIDIRHSIDGNEFLTKYSGHIGYSVRPSERKKGYATEMLQLALEYCQSIGLKKVMLGCYSDNIPSIKTIKNCGGKLKKDLLYTDGKPMQTYWINL